MTLPYQFGLSVVFSRNHEHLRSEQFLASDRLFVLETFPILRQSAS